ncbi:class I SAM-dependent methyltransferase [Halioxenophilus aromaticivorans]|uniref:Class I SAM-dependent methyltransferase n=1 Tax=Halioxenophilus aromaticivorans TaxID=1306992 RepID=A0AAV3U4N9_9ALTE
MESIKSCRSCASSKLTQILDLGVTPLADALVKPENLDKPEGTYPLSVVYCEQCTLIQIRETVPPDVLFCQDYPYYSSFSEALLKHSAANVAEIIARRKLGPQHLVVEIASNDGYLLKNYHAAGIPVLGIDPASGPAQRAMDIGVDTLVDFFTPALAQSLADEGKQADVIHANNVLAHVADTNGIVSALATLVKDDGEIVIEVPYVKDLIEHVEFDTIYHEHLCYFSGIALDKLFRRHGLYLNDVRRLSIHGGSLRLFLGKQEAVQDSVKELLAQERAVGMDTSTYYEDFAQRVDQLKHDLLALLQKLKSEGKSIAAYGAAAKGATMINYVGVGAELVDFVVDRNSYKQGLHMPGQLLPIFAPEKLLESMPDYLLILAWNFADEIRAQQSQYAERGGKFIVPVPKPAIL